MYKINFHKLWRSGRNDKNKAHETFGTKAPGQKKRIQKILKVKKFDTLG